MNVTSLLNSSAAAQAAGARLPIDQTGMSGDGSMAMYQAQERMGPARTPSDSRLSGRSRTPWDAGGYSLPLTLNVKNAQTSPASRPSFSFEATPAESAGSTSPKSPKHKFSDSRSSFSSYTTMSSNNSCHSRSHSRISSLSTVSEYQPLSSFGSDSTPTERRTSVPESGMTCPTVVEIQPPSPRKSGMEDISPEASDSDSPMTSHRARSPSDAIMMRNRGLTGSASPPDSKIGTFLHPDSPLSISARSHKRTVSAPDFPSLNGLSRPQYPSFGPMAEPTPPKSPTQGDNAQQTSQDEDSAGLVADQSAQPEVAIAPPEPEQPKCMFVQPCTTGSSLRKAISHIFGRNKLCTKSIPAHIWVHYCRKHYQRSRYRNATDYALRQVELVLIQVKKVQGWSDDNIKYNRRGDGVLKHWTLQARKREAKRLQDTESRKRRYAEEEDDDQETGSGTAIPSWLQPRLNQDYDTERMLEIVAEIKVHMDNGDINQIPDIEILPEIITDGNESRPKATVRRASTAGGHRKTQSEAYRTPPAMGAYNPSRLGMFSQDSKRIRSGASPYSFTMQNLPHRPVMGMSQPYPPYSFPQNNGFAAIAENQADHTYWNGGYNNSSVLPQPVPQRANSISAQDSNSLQQSYAPQGRPSMHARSMSENPTLRNTGYGNTDFRFPAQPGNGYQQQQQDVFGNMNMGNGQGSQPYGYQPPAPQGYGNPYGMNARDGQENPFGSYYPDWANTRNQHSRVQSTPAVHHQQPSTIPGGPPNMPAVTGPQGMLPSMYQAGPQYNDFQQPRTF